MRGWHFLLGLMLTFVTSLATAEASSFFTFATADQGRAALTVRDDFVTRLSAFDRAARLKTDRAISEREYLEFVRDNVLQWDNSAQRDRVSQALRFVERRLGDLNIQLPPQLLVVRTTGQEEGRAAYTRGTTIVLPDSVLADPDQDLVQLISHEIFHILSRTNASLRTALYKTIGFEPCPEFSFPLQFVPRKITNPDAPKNDHRILVTYQGRAAWAIPILYASTEQYDPTKGGEFFDYLEFRLALTDAVHSSERRFVQVAEVTGFFEKVGRNTQYIIHPEEILADNFALAILERSAVPSPAFPAAILKVLKDHRRAQRGAATDRASHGG
jgi:hypothetical protein